MKTKLRSFLFLIALLPVLGMGIPAFAQSLPVITRGTEVEITGIATAIGTGTITVGGQVISTAQAEIKDVLTVNALVKVHYSVAADGTLVAREVELAVDAADDFGVDELEIVGVVEAVTATSVTIGGQVIDITGAEIKDPVAVGALVKVHYSVAADASLVAREVELAANGDGEDDDINDDHGNDGPGHDINDDHGDDQIDNSGSGGSNDQNDDHGGRGSGDDGDHGGHGGDD